MREITLLPGTSIEIDGVKVTAAEPKPDPRTWGGELTTYDPATGLVSPAQPCADSWTRSPLAEASANTGSQGLSKLDGDR